MSAGKDKDRDTLERLLAMRFAAHPWHGVPIRRRAPAEVTVYVEIVPTDAMKYELDKGAGHLRIGPPAAVLELVADPLRLHPTDLSAGPASVSAAPSARAGQTSG